MAKGIVVGSGVAGLSAALMLSRSGFEVTLVERHANVAPLLRGFCRQGVSFETGFHFAGGLGRGGLLAAWLRALGLDLPYEETIPVREVFCLGGRRFSLPCGREALTGWTKTHFPASAPGMERFLDETERALLASPYTSSGQTAKKSLFGPGEGELAGEKLDALGLDEELRAVLKTRCLLFGVPAEEALWSDYAFVAGTYLSSSGTLPGGSGAFLRAWERALEQSGVEVLCGRAASRILCREEGGRFRVCGVELEDGRALEAGHVLFAGNPSELLRLLPRKSCRPAYFRHIESMRETPAPFVVYGIADRSVPERTCWYRVPGEEMFRSLECDECSMAVMTGEELPDGRKSVIATALCPEGDPASLDETEAGCYAKRKRHLAGVLKARAEAMVPELKDHWEVVEASTPRTLRRWVFGLSGSIYGFRHAADTIPLTPATRVRGLFLAGQNILLPGMLGCIVSAAVAVDLMTGTDGMLQRFRECAKEE